MTTYEKLSIKLMCRLFWLITQTPGVARYVSDVDLFTDAELSVTDDDKKIAGIEQLRQSYHKERK